MKKSDINPGMIIELTSGEVLLAVRMRNECADEPIYLLGKNSIYKISHFNDDLKYKDIFRPEKDIFAVYLTHSNYAMGFGSINYPKTLLWQRSVEITIEDLKKHFKTDNIIIHD